MEEYKVRVEDQFDGFKQRQQIEKDGQAEFNSSQSTTKINLDEPSQVERERVAIQKAEALKREEEAKQNAPKKEALADPHKEDRNAAEKAYKEKVAALNKDWEEAKSWKDEDVFGMAFKHKHPSMKSEDRIQRKFDKDYAQYSDDQLKDMGFYGEDLEDEKFRRLDNYKSTIIDHKHRMTKEKDLMLSKYKKELEDAKKRFKAPETPVEDSKTKEAKSTPKQPQKVSSERSEASQAPKWTVKDVTGQQTDKEREIQETNKAMNDYYNRQSKMKIEKAKKGESALGNWQKENFKKL